jgi:uncharacterized protein YcfL
MDLSLVVHTCDNYFKFWPGMIYSLEFYWDFQKIPVFWASEDIDIREVQFDCRGRKYIPNKHISPILTGKTDKFGFSTRLRLALEKIPSKWVLYIQEDMWLKSELSTDKLSKIIEILEKNSAQAMKIHNKLHYYSAYNLESTPLFIENSRILKYSSGENFLFTHNATIWNREYLLKHNRDGEDPWTNEIEGSKRMSSEEHLHFHYNYYWYSQPGVSVDGEFGPDFYILAPIFDDMMEIKLSY